MKFNNISINIIIQYFWYKDKISREKFWKINWCQWWKLNLKFFPFFERFCFCFCHQFPFCYTSSLINKKKSLQAGLRNPQGATPNKHFLRMSSIVVISLFDITRTDNNTPGICFVDVESSFPELSCSWIPDLWIELEIRSKKIRKTIKFTYSWEFLQKKRITYLHRNHKPVISLISFGEDSLS